MMAAEHHYVGSHVAFFSRCTAPGCVSHACRLPSRAAKDGALNQLLGSNRLDFLTALAHPLPNASRPGHYYSLTEKLEHEIAGPPRVSRCISPSNRVKSFLATLQQRPSPSDLDRLAADHCFQQEESAAFRIYIQDEYNRQTARNEERAARRRML